MLEMTNENLVQEKNYTSDEKNFSDELLRRITIDSDLRHLRMESYLRRPQTYKDRAKLKLTLRVFCDGLNFDIMKFQSSNVQVNDNDLLLLNTNEILYIYFKAVENCDNLYETNLKFQLTFERFFYDYLDNIKKTLYSQVQTVKSYFNSFNIRQNSEQVETTNFYNFFNMCDKNENKIINLLRRKMINHFNYYYYNRKRGVFLNIPYRGVLYSPDSRLMENDISDLIYNIVSDDPMSNEAVAYVGKTAEKNEIYRLNNHLTNKFYDRKNNQTKTLNDLFFLLSNKFHKKDFSYRSLSTNKSKQYFGDFSELITTDVLEELLTIECILFGHSKTITGGNLAKYGHYYNRETNSFYKIEKQH